MRCHLFPTSMPPPSGAICRPPASALRRLLPAPPRRTSRRADRCSPQRATSGVRRWAALARAVLALRRRIDMAVGAALIIVPKLVGVNDLDEILMGVNGLVVLAFVSFGARKRYRPGQRPRRRLSRATCECRSLPGEKYTPFFVARTGMTVPAMINATAMRNVDGFAFRFRDHSRLMIGGPLLEPSVEQILLRSPCDRTPWTPSPSSPRFDPR